MLHLGDITKISGYTAPIVDVVVGGSPCQDLSVAGKRAGLDGERSELFMEQLRIIKEMRERDRRNGANVDIRPRYMVWENVPGAFSSNKAEDFRIVLEKTAKVCDKDAAIPMPNNGKWTTSGCILGNGWSIAWRVCDAQFYGVPQRRRRIALIADFGGHSAPEILFVRKSVSRDTQPSQSQRKEAPSDASRGIGADDRGVKCLTPWDTQTRRVYDGEYTYPSLCSGENSGQNQQSILIRDDIFRIDGDKLNKKERKGGSGIGYRDGDKQYTLTAKDVHGVAYCFEPGAAKRLGGYVWEDLAPTLRTKVGDNRPSVAYTMQDREGKAGGGKGALFAEELSATLRAGFAQTLFQPVQCIDQGGGKSACNVQEGQAPTLTCTHGGEPAICYSLDRASFNQEKNALYDFEVSDKGVNSPLVAKGPSAVAYPEVRDGIVGTLDAHYSNFPGCRGGIERTMIATRYIVRRLTPLECERLQGYPDGWTDIGEWIDSKGKAHKTSDAARYKALGNSIALPPWKWILKRLCACYERDATLGSLFDGISGFCLLWTQLNGLGSVKWTSEIEPFPIAVCKKHFGDEETGEKGDFYEAIQSKN